MPDIESAVEPTATIQVEPDAPAQEPKETDWKAEARKWEERAKANKAAADRVAEIEAAEKVRREAEMTELEKAQAELKAERDARAAAERAALRSNIAAETKVPSYLIVGDSEEAMRESAGRALEWLEAAKATTPTAPPAAKQGLESPGESRPTQITRDQLAAMSVEERVAAFQAGQLSDMLGARA